MKAILKRFRKRLFGLIIRSFYQVEVEGLGNIPASEGALILSNHVTYIDTFFVEAFLPLRTRIVATSNPPVLKSIYRFVFDMVDTLYVSKANEIHGKDALGKAGDKEEELGRDLGKIEAALESGHILIMSPEGELTVDGAMCGFKSGPLRVLRNVRKPVLPLYIHGLWGSRFSRAPKRFMEMASWSSRRKIKIIIGSPIVGMESYEPLRSEMERMRQIAFNRTVAEEVGLDRRFLRVAKRFFSSPCLLLPMGKRYSYGDALAEMLIYRKIGRRLLAGRHRVACILDGKVETGLLTTALMSLGKAVFLVPSDRKNGLSRILEASQCDALVAPGSFFPAGAETGFDQGSAAKIRCFDFESLFQNRAKREKRSVKRILKWLPTWAIRKMFLRDSGIKLSSLSTLGPGTHDPEPPRKVSHPDLLKHVRGIAETIHLRGSDIVAGTFPPASLEFLMLEFWVPFLYRIPAVFCDARFPNIRVEWLCAEFQVSVLWGNTDYFESTLADDKINFLMFENLRAAWCLTTSFDFDLYDAFWKKFGKRLYSGLIARTNPGIYSLNIPDTRLTKSARLYQQGNRRGSMGKPVLNRHLRQSEGMLQVYEPAGPRDADMDGGSSWEILGRGSVDASGFIYVDSMGQADLGREKILAMVRGQFGHEKSFEAYVGEMEETDGGFSYYLVYEGAPEVGEVSAKVDRWVEAVIKIGALPRTGTSEIDDHKLQSILAGELH